MRNSGEEKKGRRDKRSGRAVLHQGFAKKRKKTTHRITSGMSVSLLIHNRKQRGALGLRLKSILQRRALMKALVYVW